MSRLTLMAQPHWQHFLHLPGFGCLPTPVLFAADDFFGFVARYGLAEPKPGDLALWAHADGDRRPAERLDQLARAMAVCVPNLLPAIEEARTLLPQHEADPAPPEPHADQNEKAAKLPRGGGSIAASTAPWDPIVRPSRKPPIARHVSLPPDQLPLDWQAALRRMAKGLPQNGIVVAPSIVVRMREKLCQLAWSAQNAGMAVELTEATVNCYQADLTARRGAGLNGLRWATVRASIEELYRFARYTAMPPELRRFLADRLLLLDKRERAQTALKHFWLARTGNTTDGVLDMADALLAGVDAVMSPKKRHRMRNGACILGLYPVAPLRPASADLVFGRTLFWRNQEWVIDTTIQKTHARNPKSFMMPLAADHGKFIDAVLLGDNTPSLLPKLRHEAIIQQRQLFVLPDGRPTATSYIPRVYKALTGNSFGANRTMLHTDLAIHEGVLGTYQAMIACHQLGSRTAERYKQQTVDIHAVLRRQAAGRLRRADHSGAACAPT